MSRFGQKFVGLEINQLANAISFGELTAASGSVLCDTVKQIAGYTNVDRGVGVAGKNVSVERHESCMAHLG